MPDESPSAFVDVDRDAFPIFIELIDSATDETVWSVTVDVPGVLVIPCVSELGVVQVWSRVTYPDGMVTSSRDKPEDPGEVMPPDLGDDS